MSNNREVASEDSHANGHDIKLPGLKTGALAVAALVTATVLFNAQTVAHLDRPREVPREVYRRYEKLLKHNETHHYLEHLQRSIDALRERKIYFPVNDFDCPVTYLLPAGAVVLLTGKPPLVVHNLFYLAVFFLNGLAAFAFLRAVVRSTPLALLGALVFQGCNYVLMCHYLGHMNNVQVEWIPLAFLGTLGALRRRGGAGWGWAALLGAALGMQVLSSPYYTMFLAAVTLPAFVLSYAVSALRGGSMLRRDLTGVVLRLAGAGALAGAISAFYLVRRLGAPPQRFLPPWYRPYALDHYLELLDPSDPALFVGLPAFVLGMFALRWWWDRPVPLTTAAVVTLAASLMMMVPALPGTPYWVCYHVVPMFDRMRVPLRFFPIAFLMLNALNVMYLDAICRGLSPFRRRVLVGLIAAALVGFTWLASPWVFDLDVVAAVKGVLGHKTR